MSTLHLVSANIAGLCHACGVPQLDHCHIVAAPGESPALYCDGHCPVCGSADARMPIAGQETALRANEGTEKVNPVVRTEKGGC